MTLELEPEPVLAPTAVREAFLQSRAASASTTCLLLLRKLSELTGLPFVGVTAASNQIVWRSAPEVLAVIPHELRSKLSTVGTPCVFEYQTGLLVWAFPFSGQDFVAIGSMLGKPNVRPDEVVIAAAEAGWSQQRLDKVLSDQPSCSRRILESLLSAVASQFEQESREQTLCNDLTQLNDQLETTYEEISLLHTLTRNLHVSRSASDLARLCLGRIDGRIDCEGAAMWINDKHGKKEFIAQGTLPFDETGMARLVARLENGDWSRPCVKNGIPGTPLGDAFPGLQNMVLIPIGEAPIRAGWIISCNLKKGREFGTVEASMLNSIAMILGTHARNLDLFKQNADLLLGFVRSLVSTIDAKDPYTRGHSERVARIARRIAEYLQLPPDDLQDIYLAGLLHDVGKIGVDDRILRKPGALTPEEFAEVQKHPMIGFNILHELKNLQQILPGVRNHHECMDGRGYPDGLSGEEIPLMARILAVADSFDAMGSDRPYREGMPTEKIDEIFRRGADVQWDARVIDAYFAVREDVERVCDEYRPGQEDALLAQSDAAPAA